MTADGATNLAQYPRAKVAVICEQCELLKFLDRDVLLEEFGDQVMPQLVDLIAAKLGCLRLENRWTDRCTLHYYFTHQEWMKMHGHVARYSATAIANTRLEDLKEWEGLVALCKGCKHKGTIRPATVQRKFGRYARLSDIEPHLVCGKCKARNMVSLTVRSLPR